jgi:hypothetical protein
LDNRTFSPELQGPDPTVLASATWSARTRGWILDIVCPHCADPHVHGGGDALAPEGGHRLSHCATPGVLGRGYHLVVARTKLEGALVEDAVWLAGRVKRPTSKSFRARSRSAIYGMVFDNRALPGCALLVDREYAPAHGLGEAEATIDASGPLANAMVAASEARDADGATWLYRDRSSPWHASTAARTYVDKLRYLLAAIARDGAAR